MKKIILIFAITLYSINCFSQNYSYPLRMFKDTSRIGINGLAEQYGLAYWSDTTVTGYGNLYFLTRKLTSTQSIKTAIDSGWAKKLTYRGGDTTGHGVINSNIGSKLDSIIFVNRDTLLHDPTGFTNNDNINVSYDSTTRKFTLTGTYQVYKNGRVINVFASPYTSPAHDSIVNKTFFLHYNNNGIVFDTIPWTFDEIQVAAVYYGVNDKIGYAETHGLMAWQTHQSLHNSVGTTFTSGGDISDITLNNTTATVKRPNISATTIKDEDFNVIDSAKTNKSYTLRYLTGATGVRNYLKSQTDIVPLLANRPYYNQFTGGTWQQTLFNNNDYGAIFIIAIPATKDGGSQLYRYQFVQPQQVSQTLANIQLLTPSNVSLGETYGAEFVYIGKIIIRYVGGGTANWSIIQVDKLTGSRFNQQSTTSGYLSTVATDGTTIGGNGTPTSPLYVIPRVWAYDSIILDQREINYGNGIAILQPTGVFGDLYGTQVMGCTSYIDCLDAESITITVPVLTTTPTQGIVFYDANKDTIHNSGILRTQGVANGDTTILLRKGIEIPSNAAYFRATYWNFTNSQIYGDFLCTIKYPFGTLGYGKYRPFQTGQIHFSVKVNQAVSNFWDTTSVVQELDSNKASTAVLILPDSYTKTGKPTKIIMFTHGMSRNVSYTQWGLNDTAYLSQKERFRAAGYAVFDCNGAKDSMGAAIYCNGAPQAVDAYNKSYEYIIEHYNIDKDIYVIGASMGGLVALNYCFSKQNVKALALLSPWTSNLGCGWGQNIKQPYVTYFGFANTSSYDTSKVVGFDPYTRIKTIDGLPTISYAKHPIKLWIGSTESGSVLYPYAINFIAALRNGNSDASLRIINGADHSITNGGNLVSDTEVIQWFNKH